MIYTVQYMRSLLVHHQWIMPYDEQNKQIINWQILVCIILKPLESTLIFNVMFPWGSYMYMYVIAWMMGAHHWPAHKFWYNTCIHVCVCVCLGIQTGDL